MTLDEIIEHAGLQSFDTFRETRLFQNRVAIARGDLRPKDEYRRMGYTLEMILKALAKCSDGQPVFLVEEIEDPCRRLHRKARKMARQCALDPDLIVVGVNTAEFLTREKPADRVFFDHTVDRPFTRG